MAAGLIAGAIQGLGGAMQHNAQGQIEEKRQRALMALEQDMALERDEVQHGQRLEELGQRHEYNVDELGVRHGYNVDELGVRHGYSMEQERYRQSNQNARHYSTLSQREREGNNDWQMVKTEDGGLVQYSPSRNSWREADLPEGAVMGGMDGEITERDKYRLDMLSDQAQALREKEANGMPLSAEEKAQLGRIEAQINASLGGSGGGMTTLERLLAGEGGGGTATPAGGESASRQSPTPGDQPTVRGLLSQQMEERQNTQEANEARRVATQASERADAVIQRIEREMAGGASPDGLMASINEARGRGGSVSDETMAEAQQVAEELLSLDQNPNLSADRKRWIAERLMRLQDAGVPIDLEQ